jgi:hypothetical protein
MSDDTPTDADQVRAEIDLTRQDLVQTVDALQDKLDVKTRAKTKAHDLSVTVNETATKIKQQAPPQVQTAIDRGTAAVGPAAAKAKPYRTQIAAGVAGLLLVRLIIKRFRRSA